MVDYASAVFGEQVPALTLDQARAIMTPSGSDMRAKANSQLLAAWLNYVSWSVGWNEMVDTNDDDVGDTPFHQVVAQAEALLLNASATQAQLVEAKSLAEAVDLHDAGNPTCEEEAPENGDGDGEDDGKDGDTGDDKDTVPPTPPSTGSGKKK